MKKTILILTLGALCLGSCSKNWTCKVTQNGVEQENGYSFTGTTQEKNELEADGLNTYELGGQVYVQSINCIND